MSYICEYSLEDQHVPGCRRPLVLGQAAIRAAAQGPQGVHEAAARRHGQDAGTRFNTLFLNCHQTYYKKCQEKPLKILQITIEIQGIISWHTYVCLYYWTYVMIFEML